MTANLPQPLAADGQVSVDPVSRPLLVKPAQSGHASLLWRQGHAAMVQAEGTIGEPVMFASAPGRPNVGRGEPITDGWLRFKLSRADYRKLAGEPNLSAIVVVDRQAGQILGVKFLGRQSG